MYSHFQLDVSFWGTLGPDGTQRSNLISLRGHEHFWYIMEAACCQHLWTTRKHLKRQRRASVCGIVWRCQGISHASLCRRRCSRNSHNIVRGITIYGISVADQCPFADIQSKGAVRFPWLCARMGFRKLCCVPWCCGVGHYNETNDCTRSEHQKYLHGEHP